MQLATDTLHAIQSPQVAEQNKLPSVFPAAKRRLKIKKTHTTRHGKDTACPISR